jgi:hypothetical protein
LITPDRTTARLCVTLTKKSGEALEPKGQGHPTLLHGQKDLRRRRVVHPRGRRALVHVVRVGKTSTRHHGRRNYEQQNRMWPSRAYPIRSTDLGRSLSLMPATGDPEKQKKQKNKKNKPLTTVCMYLRERQGERRGDTLLDGRVDSSVICFQLLDGWDS